MDDQLIEVLKEISRQLDVLIELLEDLAGRDDQGIIYELGENSTVLWPSENYE